MAKRVYAGIDWLTSTCTFESTADKWKGAMWHLIVPVGALHPDAFVMHSQGYTGSGAKGVFLGQRHDGWMLRLSGNTARIWGPLMIEYGGRASRIDTQITVLAGTTRKLLIEQAFQEALAFKPDAGRKPDVEMRIGRDGPRSVTIGRRSSELYFRIYDKQEESDDPHFEGCVRYEVEIKGSSAGRAQQFLLGNKLNDEKAAQLTAGCFAARGVVVPGGPEDKLLNLKAIRPETTVERKRAWLATQVAPTVEQLVSECGIGPILLDVFAGQHDHPAIHDIIDAAAKSWDS